MQADVDIVRALTDDDAAAADKAAHMLKSGARLIGAQRLSDVCTTIEEVAGSGEAGQSGAPPSRFKAEMDALGRFLDEMRFTASPTSRRLLRAYRPSMSETDVIDTAAARDSWSADV